MKWLIGILLFCVICLGDSIKVNKTDGDSTKISSEQARCVVFNNKKEKAINQKIDEINGKLDSIIIELTKDPVKK